MRFLITFAVVFALTMWALSTATAKRHGQYLRYLARHKYFVFRAGIWTGAPIWRLVIHDWSKFLPSEWRPYARKFYGPDRRATAAAVYLRRGAIPDGHSFEAWLLTREAHDTYRHVDDDFNRAWLKHQHRNPHHWQHWLLTLDNPGNAGGNWSIASPDGIGRYLDLVYATDHTGERERWDLTAEISLDQKLAPGSGHERDRKYRMLSRLVTQANRMNPLPMPEHFVREMVADWAGAGRAITGRWELGEWWAKNVYNIILHPSTKRRVQELVNHLSATGRIPYYGHIGAGTSGLFQAVKGG